MSSRWLMVHLNKPVETMRAIFTVLKPGGVMVCEEADVRAIYRRAALAGLYRIARDSAWREVASAGSTTQVVAGPIHGRRKRASMSFTWTPITRTS